MVGGNREAVIIKEIKELGQLAKISEIKDENTGILKGGFKKSVEKHLASTEAVNDAEFGWRSEIIPSGRGQRDDLLGDKKRLNCCWIMMSFGRFR